MKLTVSQVLDAIVRLHAENERLRADADALKPGKRLRAAFDALKIKHEETVASLAKVESDSDAMYLYFEGMADALNKLEYDSEGFIKRYPSESEVNAALEWTK